MTIFQEIEKTYTDRVDMDLDVSLFRFGIIRNPKDDYVIYYLPQTKQYDYTMVSLKEIEEDLKDIEEDFFNFIDSKREDELKWLKNNNLTYLINSLNAYDGRYSENCTWDWKFLKIIKYLKGGGK